jgi:hypothetical protein
VSSVNSLTCVLRGGSSGRRGSERQLAHRQDHAGRSHRTAACGVGEVDQRVMDLSAGSRRAGVAGSPDERFAADRIGGHDGTGIAGQAGRLDDWQAEHESVSVVMFGETPALRSGWNVRSRLIARLLKRPVSERVAAEYGPSSWKSRNASVKANTTLTPAERRVAEVVLEQPAAGCVRYRRRPRRGCVLRCRDGRSPGRQAWLRRLHRPPGIGAACTLAGQLRPAAERIREPAATDAIGQVTCNWNSTT